VNSHTHRQLQLALRVNGSENGMGHGAKHSTYAISSVLKHLASTSLYRLAQRAVMSRQQLGHGITIQLPATRTPLDVGEQKRVDR
jgi:hypothetical protein